MYIYIHNYKKCNMYYIYIYILFLNTHIKVDTVQSMFNILTRFVLTTPRFMVQDCPTCHVDRMSKVGLEAHPTKHTL